jgi:hypothetical protein
MAVLLGFVSWFVDDIITVLPLLVLCCIPIRNQLVLSFTIQGNTINNLGHKRKIKIREGG